jgi:hypothetical protein
MQKYFIWNFQSDILPLKLPVTGNNKIIEKFYLNLQLNTGGPTSRIPQSNQNMASNIEKIKQVAYYERVF